jgi:hypothetical protein
MSNYISFRFFKKTFRILKIGYEISISINVISRYEKISQVFGDTIVDGVYWINEQHARGKKILVEGNIHYVTNNNH